MVLACETPHMLELALGVLGAGTEAFWLTLTNGSEAVIFHCTVCVDEDETAGSR